MSVSNVQNANDAAVAAATSSAASDATSGSSNSWASQLGPNAFLQLLTTQLSNQDPLNPMDDTQSVTQLAQFSQLQSQENLTSAFGSFSQNFGLLQSSALLGHTVTVNNTTGGGTTSGTISGITVSNGTPSFSLVDSNGNPIENNGGPATFNLSQILSITS